MALGSGNSLVTFAGTGNAVTIGNGNEQILGVADGSARSGSSTVTLGTGNSTVSLGGAGNVITFAGGNETVVAGSGQDSASLGSGTSTVTFAGAGDSLSPTGGAATIAGSGAVSITDLGKALTTIGSGSQHDTILGFNPAGDVLGLARGVGGYTSVNQIVSALQKDSAGTGTLLVPKNAAGQQTGSIDFLNIAKNQFNASDFKLG